MLVYDKDMFVEITKEFTFESAHYLNEYEGECANLHGHTYKLLVTVKGTVNEIGMVMDFKELKEIVKNEVINRLDHKCLNHVVPFNPTAENLAMWIYDILSERINCDRYYVKKVELYETPTSKVVVGKVI